MCCCCIVRLFLFCDACCFFVVPTVLTSNVPHPHFRCCGGFIYLLSLPWVLAFRVTVPACERDDFQRWETESPIKWADIPALDRADILRQQEQDSDEGNGEDEEVCWEQ